MTSTINDKVSHEPVVDDNINIINNPNTIDIINTSDINIETRGRNSDRASPFEPITPMNIPSRLLVPHRLGNTMVHLSYDQRRNLLKVEKELLYKELKHNNVNTLNRFVTFLLCLLVPSVFCQVFGMGTSEWLIITYGAHYRSVGIFLACREGVAGICMNRTSSNFPRILQDRIIGETVCEVSNSFVIGYIISMWVLCIVQLLCLLISMFTILRMVFRPTRSCSSLVAMSFLLAALPCGIANCVLFHFYTSCDRKECTALNLDLSKCRIQYGWGYDVYIAAVCLDFCACITALCLSSYPYTIRSEASKLLEERRRISHEGERRASSTLSESNNRSQHPFNRFLRTVRGEGEGPAYLTAAELGVTIDGAKDWVYDDKSDLFYSFKLDMFWDPLTHGYYSRALRSWQVTPEGIVGLRRAERERREGSTAA